MFDFFFVRWPLLHGVDNDFVPEMFPEDPFHTNSLVSIFVLTHFGSPT